MFISVTMVIDQDKSGYYNTDVSCINHELVTNCDDCVHTGDGESAGLSKVPFGIIMGENLVYDGGKDDQYVFGGMTIYCSCCGA